jgi:hypothetical protein
MWVCDHQIEFKEKHGFWKIITIYLGMYRKNKN